jgi:predicted dehydrogenase
MATARVRIGVIGTGIGAEHTRALQQVPEAVVTAVCSAQQRRAEATAEAFGIPRATTDYRDLLGDNVDAVIITTPPALHRQMTLDAVAAGKHVLCEKPLAVTLDEAREMLAAAEHAGVVHMINHHMRFGATYAAMHDRIAAGFLGTPTQADARVNLNPVDYLNGSMWSDSKAGWFADAAQGGGILAGSAGPHLIDLLRWCWGDVESVCGGASVSIPTIPLKGGGEITGITAPDGCIALLRFANGGLATMRGVPIVYHRGGFSVEFNGTAGALIATNTELRAATAEDQAPEPIPLPDTPQDRVGILMRFVESIRAGEGPPAPTFADGVAVQAILAALDEAIATGTWVPVAERRSP